MATVREPAVAGTFYPAEAQELRGMVRGFLASAKASIPAPKAIIVPHAGYVYSGPIAASAYACVAQAGRQIKRVVLMGPAHRVTFDGLAVHSADAFATPLGSIPVDRRSIEAICELPQVHLMDEAHHNEHSLEVHLPFLQEAVGNFTIVPLVVGDAQPEDVGAVLDTLWGGAETVIVISSDLSHYHDYETARQIDAETSRAIEALQLEEIHPSRACGCHPIQGLLVVVRRRRMTARVIDLRNSGDTAGPRDHVVGYGAYVFT